MLIEFRVKNYRSFRQEAVLSLVASNNQEFLETNTANTGVPAIPRVVRSAAVYGANASGKSNLMRGLLLMRGVVLESASLQPQQRFNVQPFRLDHDSRNEPTLFEVTVLLAGVRYQYGFEFTEERIVAEWLLVYQKAKPQRWLDRRLEERSNKEIFEFSSHLLGQKRVWQESTRSNALFLSTAVQLNSEQLQPLYAWFRDSLNVFLDGGQLPFDFSNQVIQAPGGHSRVISLLTSADIGIASISTETVKALQHKINLDLATGKQDAQLVEREILVPKFRHTVDDVSEEFSYPEESQGTQKLFSLAGPLLDIIAKGRLLVIDELDRSLHPLLVHQIVQTFQNPEINVVGAQLIFTTHDTSLLYAGLLRRDQVWLMEKLRDQSSELVPLSEFSPRKGEALEKGYLSGRYGGVPILREQLLAGSPSASR